MYGSSSAIRCSCAAVGSSTSIRAQCSSYIPRHSAWLRPRVSVDREYRNAACVTIVVYTVRYCRFDAEMNHDIGAEFSGFIGTLDHPDMDSILRALSQ